MTECELIERAKNHAKDRDIPVASLINPTVKPMAVVSFSDETTEKHTQVILDPETGELFLLSYKPQDGDDFVPSVA